MWSLDPIPAHNLLWQQLEFSIRQQKLPHAMLLIGPEEEQALSFAQRLIAVCVCEQAVKPCKSCSSCVMLSQGVHPDVQLVMPEGAANLIKIDVIRALQLDIYQTPQRAKYRFVIINPADSLNRAAVNALLKIVEEPPAHAVYLFITNNLDSIPATLVSRCQRLFFSFVDSPLSLLTKGSPLLHDFTVWMQGQLDVCSLAQTWEPHSFDVILRFLYEVTATLIQAQLRPSATQPAWVQQCRIHPVHLFMQLDTINQLKQMVSQCQSLNKPLAIERVLLTMRGYLSDD